MWRTFGFQHPSPWSNSGGWLDASNTLDTGANPSNVADRGAAPADAFTVTIPSLFDAHTWAGTPLDDNLLLQQALEQQASEKLLQSAGGAWALHDPSHGGEITAYMKSLGDGRLTYFDPSGKLLGSREDQNNTSIFYNAEGQVTSYVQSFREGTQWIDPQGNVYRIDLQPKENPPGVRVGSHWSEYLADNDTGGNKDTSHIASIIYGSDLDSATITYADGRQEVWRVLGVAGPTGDGVVYDAVAPSQPTQEVAEKPVAPIKKPIPSTASSSVSLFDPNAEQERVAAAVEAQSMKEAADLAAEREQAAQASFASSAARFEEQQQRANVPAPPIPVPDLPDPRDLGQPQAGLSARSNQPSPGPPDAPPGNARGSSDQSSQAPSYSRAYYGYGGAYEGPEAEREALLKALDSGSTQREGGQSPADPLPGSTYFKPEHPFAVPPLLFGSINQDIDEIINRSNIPAERAVGHGIKFALSGFNAIEGIVHAPDSAETSLEYVDRALDELDDGSYGGYVANLTAAEFYAADTYLKLLPLLPALFEFLGPAASALGEAPEAAEAAESTAEVGAGASRPAPEARLPGSYLDWTRQNVVSNSPRVPLQGPMQCGPYSTEIVSGVPAETMIKQLGPRLTSNGVDIRDLAKALEEIPETRGQFGWLGWNGNLDVQAIQELTADGPVVAHFPVFSVEEYTQIDGHFMVIEGVTASGDVMLLDTELGQSFEVTMGELDAAWSREYIGRR